MILHALADYYQRRAANDPTVVRPGYSMQKITFEVVLKPDGTLFRINPVSINEEKRTGGKSKIVERALEISVPGQTKKPGKTPTACFLWDNLAFILGYEAEESKKARAPQCHAAFKKKHLALKDSLHDEGFQAVCTFLANWNPDANSEHLGLANIKPGNGVFKIQGELCYVHERPAIRAWLGSQLEPTEIPESGMCLITGNRGPIARLMEPKIKGVRDANPIGALLVSFEDDAYRSFGKEQGANAPISRDTAFEFCNGLNLLLGTDKHKRFLGDTTIVFWTDAAAIQETPEDLISYAIDPSAALPQDDELRQRVERVLHDLANGILPEHGLGPADTKFYLLGLSPNAARLSVRFWEVSRLGDFVERLQRHFQDIQIVRQFGDDSKRPDPKLPAIWQLLDQTCPLKNDKPDREKIPPLLGGALLRAILTGQRYPEALALTVLRRLRVQRNVNYLQAAILRGWLVRNHQQKVPHMLDLETHDPAYRLGRLFAALEKTQQDALGDLNAGIRDRYYGSASATPGSVFPRLLRGYQHHLGKLKPGHKVNREKLTQEILSVLPATGFPRHLNLLQQGQFAIGYYHQRQSFFEKTKTD